MQHMTRVLLRVNGTVASASAALVASPFALIRTRLQAQSNVKVFGHSHQAKTMKEAVRHIVSKEGIRGLYVGSSAQCFRVGFTSGTQLAFYDSCRQQLFRSIPVDWHVAVPILTALSTAVWTSMLAHPLDVILVRLYNQNTAQGKVWYKGPLDAAVKTYRSEGLRGLYKGFSATFLRQVPHTIVTFTILEALRKTISSPSEGDVNNEIRDIPTSEIRSGRSGRTKTQ